MAANQEKANQLVPTAAPTTAPAGGAAKAQQTPQPTPQQQNRAGVDQQTIAKDTAQQLAYQQAAQKIAQTQQQKAANTGAPASTQALSPAAQSPKVGAAQVNTASGSAQMPAATASNGATPAGQSGAATPGTASSYAGKVTITSPEVQPLEHLDTSEMESTLQQWMNAATAQQEAKIDYATQQGVNELERAKEDAQEQFQVQRDQIAQDEAKALDNQALYAEARGDRGGIGQAQYNQIQNAAATNRVTVNKAQTKLSTDTARQIAELRANGEYEKADAVLEVTQNYLSQLYQLYQMSAQYNLSVDQFNAQLTQWGAEYEMGMAELGMKEQQMALEQEKWLYSVMDNERAFAAQQEQLARENEQADREWAQYLDRDAWERAQAAADAERADRQWEWQTGQTAKEWEWQTGQTAKEWEWQKSKYQQEELANAGYALLEAGIKPSDSQLKAMGMTSDQAGNYIAALKLYSSGRGGGTGDDGTPDNVDADNPNTLVDDLARKGLALTEDDPTAGLSRLNQLAIDIRQDAKNNPNYTENDAVNYLTPFVTAGYITPEAAIKMVDKQFPGFDKTK